MVHALASSNSNCLIWLVVVVRLLKICSLRCFQILHETSSTDESIALVISLLCPRRACNHQSISVTPSLASAGIARMTESSYQICLLKEQASSYGKDDNSFQAPDHTMRRPVNPVDHVRIASQMSKACHEQQAID